MLPEGINSVVAKRTPGQEIRRTGFESSASTQMGKLGQVTYLSETQNFSSVEKGAWGK